MRWLRVLRGIGIGVVAALLLAAVAVRVQHWVLRSRCERLLADFQSIRLHQSTWADAQRMMTRWGRWGHYEGSCTATDCGYTITLEDQSQDVLGLHAFETRLYPIHQLARLERVIFGELGELTVMFRVQDGTIWRKNIQMQLAVPAQDGNVDDFGYGVIVSERSSPQLSNWPGYPWMAGRDEQLAEHPNYKVGSPTGCEICMAVRVTFTPALAPEELKRISAFDFSCLTRFTPCRTPMDLLPVAYEWRQYASMTGAPDAPAEPSMQPRACPVPVLARARDAWEVLVVDVLSTQPGPVEKELTYEEPPQEVKARVAQVLKGGPDLRAGGTLSLVPWVRSSQDEPWKAGEHMEPGRRYLVFVPWPDHWNRIKMEYCGVLQDSATARAEAMRGLEQNDRLRHAEE